MQLSTALPAAAMCMPGPMPPARQTAAPSSAQVVAGIVAAALVAALVAAFVLWRRRRRKQAAQQQQQLLAKASGASTDAQPLKPPGDSSGAGGTAPGLAASRPLAVGSSRGPLGPSVPLTAGLLQASDELAKLTAAEAAGGARVLPALAATSAAGAAGPGQLPPSGGSGLVPVGGPGRHLNCPTATTAPG